MCHDVQLVLWKATTEGMVFTAYDCFPRKLDTFNTSGQTEISTVYVGRTLHMCSDGCVLVTMRHGAVLRTVLVHNKTVIRHATHPLLPFGPSTQLEFCFVSVGLSNFFVEDFVVELEETFVKEVVDVLATAGLVAPPAFCWDSNKYDREACGYLQCCGWRPAKMVVPDC